jgi:hypothetical protein
MSRGKIGFGLECKPCLDDSQFINLKSRACDQVLRGARRIPQTSIVTLRWLVFGDKRPSSPDDANPVSTHRRRSSSHVYTPPSPRRRCRSGSLLPSPKTRQLATKGSPTVNSDTDADGKTMVAGSDNPPPDASSGAMGDVQTKAPPSQKPQEE